MHLGAPFLPFPPKRFAVLPHSLALCLGLLASRRCYCVQVRWALPGIVSIYLHLAVTVYQLVFSLTHPPLPLIYLYIFCIALPMPLSMYGALGARFAYTPIV